jgi:Tol biopolymer transport system component
MNALAAPHDLLHALIEEARERARRRHRRYAAAALAAVAAAAAFALMQRGGAEHAAVAAPVRSVTNGALTLADVETVSPGESTPGWYGVSTLGADGRLHPIARCPDGASWCGETEGIAWSPDGTRLAVGVTSVGNANPYNGLHVIDPATGADRTIRPCRPADGECDWFDVTWSPDGSKLAYVSGGVIAVVDSDGSQRSVITAGASPSWSPDGQWLAFAASSEVRSELYIIRADGTDRRLVVADGSAPAWSPSGATIAYHAGCGGIKLVTPAGRDVTPGTAARRCHVVGLEGSPVWSPDGTKIAVAGTTRYGTGAPARGTYVMNADGTDLARVTMKTQGIAMQFWPRPAWRPVPLAP